MVTPLVKRVYVFNRSYDSSGNGFCRTSGMQLLDMIPPLVFVKDRSSARGPFKPLPPVSRLSHRLFLAFPSVKAISPDVTGCYNQYSNCIEDFGVEGLLSSLLELSSRLQGLELQIGRNLYQVSTSSAEEPVPDVGS